LKIAVLHGGPSSEHDISVWSSKGAVRTLRALGHDVLPVYVDKHGLWHAGGDDAGETVAQPQPMLVAVQALQSRSIDVCFLGFHGTYGEDGRVQAVLDLVGLKFTGSGVLASAAAMDKPLARRIFRGVGLPVAEAVELPEATCRTPEFAHDQAAVLVAKLGLPVVVKVPAGGSSVGVEIPRTQADLAAALQRLSPHVAMLLCEQFIHGVELTAGVLERPDGTAEALPIVEIAPKSAAFFDFAAKYNAGATDEIVPARISAEATARVQAIGLAAHKALGCRGVSRTDVILMSGDQPYVLETNTLPGLTPASLLPKAAAHAGLDYAALLTRIVANALQTQPGG
jgi:D-alanine-D-alanine ligase